MKILTAHVQFPTDISADMRAPIARPRREGSLYRRGFKRAFDLAFVLATAPVTLPVTLLLALLVVMDGANPFYSQTRIGRGGRLFRLWKIRTMVPDADAALAACLAGDPARREEWQRDQKIKDDPRVTRIGRFLRKSSLDELPQFLNVLIGDMSVIGPRPMMVTQAPLYPGRSYYAMRPGVTGLWQVSDRNRSSFADRAGFDDDYYAQMSFAGDSILVARTIAVILRGTGC